MSDLFDLLGERPANYPDVPGVKERRLNSASRKAAESITPGVNTLRAKVFAVFKTIGPMTADEVAGHLQLDVLSIRPRVAECVRMGLLIATEERRPRGMSSTVWRAAP